MTEVFLYGTLRHVPLLQTVLGRAVAQGHLQEAALPGYRTCWAEGQAFPLILPEAGGAAQGLLLSHLSQQDLDRLDYYEQVFDYQLIWVDLTTPAGARRVQMFWPPESSYAAGAAFDLADWAARWGAINCRAAAEVMGYWRDKSPQQLAGIYPMIHARAASWVQARQENAPRHSNAPGREGVEVLQQHRPYVNFFAMEEQQLRFRRYDGGMSAPVSRAAFVGTDAALVLPYDPRRDRVMLIEQFRMGPWVRGDDQPWQLEPIAGRVDAGESPEDCARREAQEEAGLHLARLEVIHRGYPSPGCSSEYFHVFCGLADLPDTITGVGGMAGEQEDIRSLLFEFDEAMAMLERGQLRITPTAMALFWLARNRERLRRDA